jgi:hypothetical protein
MKQLFQQWINYSVFVNTLKGIHGRYRVFENNLDEIYSCSICHRILSGLWDGICTACRYSIFGRLTEIGEGEPGELVEPIPVLENSKVAQRILTMYSLIIKRISFYSKECFFVISGIEIKNSFQQKPLKIGGIILVTAIPVNFLLILIAGVEMSYLGVGMRVILFLLGLAGLYSNVDLEKLKEGSIFIKKIEGQI